MQQGTKLTPAAMLSLHGMKQFWHNFPLPEPFIIALLIGGIVQVVFPYPLLPHGSGLWIAGLVLGLSGLALASWAAISAGGSDLAKPSSLVTDGPYAFSRNPMYLAWGIFSAGLSLVVNSLWLAIAVLFAFLYLNYVTIPKEEQVLQRNFGAAYEAYRQHVRRWL